MNAGDFWRLERAERSERIVRAIDTGTCSVCEKPIEDGQPANGLVHAHWSCAELPPAPTQADFDKTLKKIDELIGAVAPSTVLPPSRPRSSRPRRQPL